MTGAESGVAWTVSQPAEWLAPQRVLVCAPAMETFAGVLAPDAANFREPFSIEAARREHAALCAVIEDHGARTLDVRDVLVEAPRGQLTSWARDAVQVRFDDSVDAAQRARAAERFDATLRALGARELVDLLLLRPTVTLRANPAALDATSALRSTLALEPLSNAYYMRDPLMTTRAGVVLNRLRLDVRAPETALAAHVLATLGITPLLAVTAPGTVEGGDFIPCGDFVLQGIGLLTNREGVRQLLDAGAYGFVEVGCVVDERAQMDEMHLDTYFAVLSARCAALCDDRMQPGAMPAVEVYRPGGEPGNVRYTFERRTTLPDYLREKGLQIVPFSKDEQERFAPNGLIVAPNVYAYVAGAGDAFAERVRAAGVSALPLAFDALAGGYGGPHCSTQVLVRA